MTFTELSMLSGALTVCRHMMQTSVYQAITGTLSTLQTDAAAFCAAYANLAGLVYEQGTLDQALLQELRYDENVLTAHLSEEIPAYLLQAADADLRILSALSALTPASLKATAQMRFPEYKAAISALPSFPVGNVFPITTGEALCTLYRTEGYGYFARGSAFVVRNGKLSQIPAPDITLKDLKGYEWQKQAIMENTAAFLQGEDANNILLYGDKGCGKSSTVKAIARHFASEGLKIIAFTAKEVASFGQIYPLLEQSPYRFILFMDDLSFDTETPEFVALKAFMEGGMAEKNKNTLIYATSNRRHLIKETHSDRQGDDMHLRETLETQTSLSDRFGMEIIFSVPSKEEYLSIVEALAQEAGLSLEPSTLFQQAEAFAIRKNGRSPRTAQQFIRTIITKRN